MLSTEIIFQCFKPQVHIEMPLKLRVNYRTSKDEALTKNFVVSVATVNVLKND